MARGKIFAVAGNPVLHSISPAMHNAAFVAAGMDAAYTRIAAWSAEDALSAAREIGMAGINVTSPFKEGAAALCAKLGEGAGKTGAANTIVFRGGKALGSNTDCDGVIGALSCAGVKPGGRRAVVLGAGGAAKAAAYALMRAGAKVTIANKTVLKAKRAAEALGCQSCGLRGRAFEDSMKGADIVVSAISTGERVVPPRLLKSGMAVLDAIYYKPTAISGDAKSRGCKVIPGREWLLHQGARAFELFTGKKASLPAMRRALAACAKPGGKRNIALIGFMGSGKTTVARKIARAGRMRMVEIDDNVAERAGRSIREIFEADGEAAFRKMEREEIAKVLCMRNCVISCGGGAVLDERNVAALRRSCIVAWLWASPKEIAKRVKGDSSRPLLNVRDKEGVLGRILERRIPLYASASDLVAGTEGKTPSEVAGLILDEVAGAGHGAGKRERVDSG